MKRVKVQKTYCRKTFFEKVLLEWKDTIEDRNFRFVISKALVNLRNFPLEVHSIGDLKNVKGIGDYLAQKLEVAWNNFYAQQSTIPDIKDVKRLKKGDALQFMQLGSNTLEIPKRSTKERSSSDDTFGNLNANAKKSFAKEKRSQAILLPAASSGTSTVIEKQKGSDQKPCSSLQADVELLACNSQEFSSDSLPSKSSPVFEKAVDDGLISDKLFQYSFADQNAEVILLADNREHHGGRNGQSVCEHLDRMNQRYIMRNLSVGDYLWVQRSASGVETVLDCVVERKTFDDLSKSIRQGRYEEQKERLLSIGLRSVIYVVEGNGVPDAAIEQALATTQIANGFLVYRTTSVRETAQFLCVITKRLIERANTRNEYMMTFEAFQKNAKKTQRRCVSDLFLRQLTVCPQLNASKAALIVSRFPTFASLADFYSSASSNGKETLLADTIPGISKALSKQLCKFFENIVDQSVEF